MTNGQKGSEVSSFLALSYSALHNYLFEVVVWGVNAS